MNESFGKNDSFSGLNDSLSQNSTQAQQPNLEEDIFQFIIEMITRNQVVSYSAILSEYKKIRKNATIDYTEIKFALDMLIEQNFIKELKKDRVIFRQR